MTTEPKFTRKSAFEVLSILTEARQRRADCEAKQSPAQLVADQTGDDSTVKQIIADRDFAIAEEDAARRQIDRMTEPVRKAN